MKREEIKQKAVESISDYEDFIRNFIIAALKDTYNDWREGIPNKASIDREGMLDRWRNRRKSSLGRGVAIHQSLIAQADFSDYKQIIEYRKNWRKIFNDIFIPSNKNRLLVYLEDIADFRHKIFHSKGDISETELYHIQHEINWIKDKAGREYPSLLTNRRYDTKRGNQLSVELENISPDIQIRFSHLINECLGNIEDSEQRGVKDSFDDIVMLIKKEIDRSNKDHVIFILQESFLKTYKHVYEYSFILKGYFDLVEYAYERDKELAADMIDAFDYILESEVYSSEDVEKVEPIADLFLDVGIAFIDRDPDISQRCFYHLINSSEDMWSRVLFSKLLIAGGKLVQIESPSEDVRKLRDVVIARIEENDWYAKGERYFTYLEDAFFYMDDEEFITSGKKTAEKYGISVGGFYDKYLKPMISSNIEREVKDYIDHLEQVSADPERDTNCYFDDFEEFLSKLWEDYEVYEDDYLNILDEMSKSIAEKIIENKSPEFKKMMEEFAVIEDSRVSGLVKKSLSMS